MLVKDGWGLIFIRQDFLDGTDVGAYCNTPGLFTLSFFAILIWGVALFF